MSRNQYCQVEELTRPLPSGKLHLRPAHLPGCWRASCSSRAALSVPVLGSGLWSLWAGWHSGQHHSEGKPWGLLWPQHLLSPVMSTIGGQHGRSTLWCCHCLSGQMGERERPLSILQTQGAVIHWLRSFVCLRQGLTMQPRPALHSPFSCLCLPSAGITGGQGYFSVLEKCYTQMTY
jgi:hypothetical protein